MRIHLPQLDELICVQREQTRLLEMIIAKEIQMSVELDNLTKAVTDIETAVTAAIAKLGTPAPADGPQLQALADSLNKSATALNAAVNPPAPTT